MNRSALAVIGVAAGLLLAGLLGCPPPPNPPDPPPDTTPGSVTGHLSVTSDATSPTFFEHEPNDDLATAQFISNIAPLQHLTIFGHVSLSDGDRFDGFEFVTTQDSQIDVKLQFQGDATADLDLSVDDFKTFACAPSGVGSMDFAHCFDNPGNPKTGSFRINGPFVLVITPFAGAADYQLDVTVSDPTAAAALPIAQPSPVAKASAPPMPPAKAFSDVPETCVPGEVIVKFDGSLTPAEEDRVLADSGMQRIERSPSGYCRVACPLHVAVDATGQERPMVDTLRAKSLLRAQKGIRTSETNDRRYIATVPNDPYFRYQWHYDAINLPDAWSLTTGSPDVVVAVVDTGILSGHPDLQGKIEGGYCFISDPASARNGVGRTANPEDFGDSFGGPGQSSFHGTHTAGTIAAATNNGIGGAGIAWNSKIMPLRVLGVGGGTTFDLAEAIRYAAGLPNVSGTVPPNPARIINLSVAGLSGLPASSDESSAIADAINAGALVVAAAGNQTSNSPTYPAASPGVVGVGAVDIQLNRAIYSNFGPWMSLVAPGGSNGTDINGDGYGDGVLSTCGSDAGGTISFEYIFSNGTSMAAPHVSGVAALVMAANPSLTASDVRDVLQKTARDLGAPGRDDQFGFGLVDAAAAVREAIRRGGGNPGSTPILALSTTSLDFGSTMSNSNVYVSNTGGGFLNISSVTASETNGTGWLAAQPVGSSAGASADTLFITVNRAVQPAGTYHGSVTVTAEGVPPQTIQVAMIVGQAATTAETVYVLAVTPPPDQQTVAETTTSSDQGYAYTIPQLPPGQYVLYAGTDRNNDGLICEVGDLCGALPSLIEPQTLTLTPGQNLTQEDFSVSQRVLQQGPLAKPPQTLRRLY